MDPGILALLIPLLAIGGACGIAFGRIFTRHRERMAMIEAGMHPDDPQAGPLEDEAYPDDRDWPERDPGSLPAGERGGVDLKSRDRTPHSQN